MQHTPDSPPKRGRGRPSIYSTELAQHCCDLIAKGIAVEDFDSRDDVPSERTIYNWLIEKPDFFQEYARARERLADRYATQVITIADKADPTTMRGIEHARTRIDARKWAAGKMAPKKYGDTRRMELAGHDGGAIKSETRIDLSGLSDAVLAELAALAGQ